MKEVTLFSDDAKSRESAQQLGQVSFHSEYVGNFNCEKRTYCSFNDFVFSCLFSSFRL